MSRDGLCFVSFRDSSTMPLLAPVDDRIETLQSELRRVARRRTWICPGAGFATHGHPRAAAFAYFSGLFTVAAAAYAVWRPSREGLIATVALFAASTAAWLVELATVYWMWPSSGDAASSSFVGRRYRMLAALILVFAALLAWGVVRYYGVYEMRDAGMSPTVRPGERIVYRAEVKDDRLQPGTLTLFRLSPENRFGEAGTMEFGRILAVPGDRLQMRNGMYWVNGVAQAKISPTHGNKTSLIVMGHPSTTIVPKDCYFVVQEAADGGLDSRVLHWARREDFVATTFYRLNRFPPLQPIE